MRDRPTSTHPSKPLRRLMVLARLRGIGERVRARF
jgi:hypothetical protein